jgi:hypothetical protein
VALLRRSQWEVAMLAEIFMLKLEFLWLQQAAKRVVSDRARFVPIALPADLRTAPARA